MTFSSDVSAEEHRSCVKADPLCVNGSGLPFYRLWWQEVKLDVFEELVDLLARSKLPPDATAQA